MRKNIVAGNWKMNKDLSGAQQLMNDLLAYTNSHNSNCEVYIAPPAVYSMLAKDIFENSKVENVVRQ